MEIEDTVEHGLLSIDDKVLYRADLAYFAEEVLNMEISHHHQSWSELIIRNRRLAIEAPRDHGKTQSVKDSLVLLSSGVVRRFDELKVGDEVLSLGEDLKIHKNKIQVVQNCGKKKIVKITTRTGREVHAALTHPFRKFEGWEKAENLKVGDRIAVPRHLKLNLPDFDVSNDEISLLGHYIANGCHLNSLITSSKYFKEVSAIVERLGVARRVRREGDIGLRRDWFGDFLEKYNLSGKLSIDKTIPDQVFQFSNRQLVIFIRSLWSDGHIGLIERGNGQRQVSIDLCMGSKKLIKQMHHLLLRIGVISYFSEKKVKYVKADGSFSKAWRVSITGRDNQLRFLDLFDGYEKEKEFLKGLEPNSQNDQIPDGWKDLLKRSAHWHRINSNIRIDNRYCIGRDKLLRVASSEGNDKLENLALSDVLWDEISSIEDAAEEECWDIQVENDHNYICNDVFSHNSFFFSFAYPIWRAYHNWLPSTLDDLDDFESIPRVSLGYIFSNTQDQAIKLLEIIKRELEDNPKLAHLVPFTKDVWSKTEIKLRNGAIIRARGWGQSVRGAHPVWISCDDTLNDETIYSEVTRNKQIDYFFSAVTPMLVPGGQLIVVGTPFHREDLYQKLSENRAYFFHRSPALSQAGEPLWPTRYSKDMLIKRKEEVGSTRFAREYLCLPISDDSSLFPERIIDGCMDPEFQMPTHMEPEWRKNLRIYTGVDLALSSTVGADYTVITTLGVDEFQNRWILDIRRKKGYSMMEQLLEIQDVYKTYRPLKILIEDNGFQRVFRDELVRNTDLPVEGFTTGGHNKNSVERGVPSLQILFENRKFKIPRKTQRCREKTDVLINELRCFTWQDGKLQGLGAHDDCVMSLWIANECVNASSFNFSFVGD